MYLERKTRAADRGSKARRSLGNLYALLVLAEDFANGKSSRFTDLLARMKALPFGSKLQNHPLDNRLNDEFGRQMGVSGELLPVVASIENGQKGRRISIKLLESGGSNPKTVADFIIEVVNSYIDILTSNQDAVLKEIGDIADIDGLVDFFEAAFSPQSDARLFEVVSYVLLAEYFSGKTVLIGETVDQLERVSFRLFKTGRTNANDGGIDFVLQPFGRFFQVTETLEFSKYFLDFEKTLRFPTTFVIKTEIGSKDVLLKIERDARSSNGFSAELLDRYMGLFEEVFTLKDLREIARELSPIAMERIKINKELQFKLEYGLLD